MATGMWHVVDATYADVFAWHPIRLWRTMLRRQPSALAWFSTWVEESELN